MTLGELMDLMNRDYDRNDPKFLKEVQLGIYKYANDQMGMGHIVEKVRDNMVMSPETIGLSKDNPCLNGMQQAVDAIDTFSKTNTDTFEANQTRTR